jgi:hypothetical protein
MATGFDWFCPDDLPIFLKALQKTPTPAILVGGQSLTFWIDRFDITIPPIETPYLTMDEELQRALLYCERIVAVGVIRYAFAAFLISI